MGKSFLATDAFDLIAKFKRTVILAKGELLESGAEGAGERTEIAAVILEIADVFDAGAIEHLLRDLAHAKERAHGQWPQKRDFFIVGDYRKAIGLFMIARDFGKQLVGGDANSSGQLPLGKDLRLQSARERNGFGLQLARR